MKIIKKISVAGIIIICLAFIVIAVWRIDFGALAIDIIERLTHVDISYDMLDGSIFQGYRIEHYCVRLSETDSIYGERAEIYYRFIPSLLRLPNLFEITLLEPHVTIKRKHKDTKKGDGRFSLPTFSTGIRLNIKNGSVEYQTDKLHTVNAISGLIFVDLIGSVVYLNTINLSFRNPDPLIAVQSMNADMRLTEDDITVKSLRVRGNGFAGEASGVYNFNDEQGTFTIDNTNIDLATLDIYTGSVDISGQITITKGVIQPNLKGTAYNVNPLEHGKFETNMFGDTIFVNVFDGSLYRGTVFAQIKVLSAALYEIDANFRDLDLASLIEIDQPLLISGYMAYRDHMFQGFVSSPYDGGVGVESLFVSGVIHHDSVYIDSLILQETERILSASGRLIPACDMTMRFNELSIGRFARFTSLDDTLFEGTLSGSCHIECPSQNIVSLRITAAVSGRDLRIGDISITEFRIKSDEFVIQDQTNTIECHLLTPSYRSESVDSMYVTITDRAYSINAKKEANHISIQGTLHDDLAGTITSLAVLYRGIEIQNNAPITFDIPARSLSDFDLSFAYGTLRGSIVPFAIEVSDVDLGKVSTLFGLPDPVNGTLECRIRRNRMFVTAHHVNFLGLTNGEIRIKGEINNDVIIIDTCSIEDNLQHLTAYATLALDSSLIHTSFENVGVWVLPFLDEFMLNPQGRMNGTLELSGNAQDYAFQGTVLLTQGSFGIEPIASHFDSVHAEVIFDGTRIQFKDGQGMISRMGRFAALDIQSSTAYTGGIITLGPRFRFQSMHFDFSFQDAPLQFMPFAYGIGSGNISLGVRNDTTYYNGAITLKQAIVPLEFGQVIEEDTTSADEEWTMNIKIKGERNIWLRNRDADIEMSGELYLIKDRGPLYLTGQLTTHRGNYYWLNHTLSITEGQITFLPQEPVEAELDIWAEMNTRDRDPTTGTPITIKLHMFGTISEPIFEFFSDPPYYTEQDIVTYLNLNITWSELESMKRGDFVRTVLPHSLVSWLESDVSRRIRQYTGLDYFRIETPFFEDESSTRLTVGKYISRRLFISYTYDITSFENEFNVEYFIDDKNEILVRRDEEGDYSIQYQYRIRF